jgi:leader peptidase (prepilin peptidase)/N-methyltransferase
MDWDTQLISTYVCIFIALIAVIYYIFNHEAIDLPLSSRIIGFFVVSVPLMLIVIASKERAMGWGDVYLMAAGGLFLGAPNILIAMLIALIVGSVCGLIIKHANGNSVFAFGPYLSIGIAVSALYCDKLADWYVQFTGLDKTLEDTAGMIATIFC